ncbi:MAG TPA: SusC/RagA family TonB-linked outer membrane protein [Gemmatimonadaceae bacterium]|nr:SusC/RagA family TonB-linked outer membrane protein [Gemmatimonadaceae bacterium]
MRNLVRGFFTSLVCTALGAGIASAQQVGAVHGRVTDKGSGAPIANAVITIVGTHRGARTDDNGEYQVTGVAAGARMVRVNRLGYSASTQQATVPAGGEVTVNFGLTTAATQLEEVMVTATGATERKRQNGNDVGIISMSKDVNLAATPNFTDVLSARTAGLTVSGTSGEPGTSSRIRIRGANSVSLSNEPLIIIDGVRVDNSAQSFNQNTGGQTISRFDDINPEDIASIEVLKGPAASALYGTAASNGVIQITTKRGRAGSTLWRTFAEGGSMVDPTNYPSAYYNVGTTLAGAPFNGSCTNDRTTLGLCKQGSIVSFNAEQFYHVEGQGNTRHFGLSTSGGSDQAQYFISGDVNRAQGTVAPNHDNGFSLRTNVTAQLKPNINSTVTANYVQRDVGLPQNDNDIYGVMGNVLLGHAFNCAPGVAPTQCHGDTLSRGFYSAPPSTFYYWPITQDAKRFQGGANTTWQMTSWLTGVGQAGMDVNNMLDQSIDPANVVTWINQGLINGSANQVRGQNLDYTAQGSLVATHTLPHWSSINTSTTVGGQYVNEQQHTTSASGTQLVPGTASLATASANKNIGESNQTIITVGGYVHEQLAWRDRLFLTASIRGDENSAFGQNFKLAYYPALSASWVVSDEPYFHKFFEAQNLLSSLRLRSAYGVSGQKPGFRQADTYLNGAAVAAPGSQELTAVVIGGTGNANLKPEISTESEVGADLGLWQDRASLTYTHYSKTTRDALIARTLAPSLGVSSTQFVNLGQVYNAGNELQLDATVLDRRDLKFELSASASNNTNKLVHLGNGMPPIVFNNGDQMHREGYALGGYWQRKILSYADLNGDGILSRANCAGQPQVPGAGACEVVLSDTAMYRGSPLPTRTLTVSPEFTLFQTVKLTALFDYRGGFYNWNFTQEFRCTVSAFNTCPEVNNPHAPLADQAAAIARLEGSSWGYIQPGDFTKLREVSATITLPTSWAHRLNASGLSLTVAGRNLHTWTKYKGFDPEINSQSPTGFSTTDFLTQPPLRMWTTRLDVSF